MTVIVAGTITNGNVKMINTKCRLWKAAKKHTLRHYILECQKLEKYRGGTQRDMDSLIRWMVH